MTTKFTQLEVEIITDRPEECIIECSCDFYEDYLIKIYGDRNRTKDIIIETNDASFRPLARIREFNFTTTKETINIDLLGDEFQQMYKKDLIK